MPQRYDRFGGDMNIMKCWTERTKSYTDKCNGALTNLPSDAYQQYNNVLSSKGQTDALIYTYTLEQPKIYGPCNKAMKEDKDLDTWGGYVYFLKKAMKDKAAGQGWYKGMSYRGSSLPAENMYLYQHKGRSFMWPSFLSTSKLRTKAEPFWGTVLFEINNNGTGTTYSVDIENASYFGSNQPDDYNEREVLIYPYTAFEIEDFRWSGSKLVVQVKTVDTVIYERSWMSRVDTMLNVHTNKILNAQCFYKGSNGKCLAALSWATRPAELSGSGSTISARSTLKQAAEFIDAEWNKSPSRNCMHLNYGCGKWGILTNSKFGTAQSYKWGGSIDDVKSWISTKWSEKYMITSWAGGEGKWFVVMTKGVEGIGCGFGNNKRQAWRTRTTWSEINTEIDKMWADGYVITSIAYEDQLRTWMVIFTESRRGQRLKWAKEFPTAWVKEQCDNNYAITTLLRDPADDQYLVIMTTDRGVGNNWSWNYEV